ncbi:MAG: hypothetical protein ACTSQY_02865 [Candidatus Odinarchaeia archaeon]
MPDINETKTRIEVKRLIELVKNKFNRLNDEINSIMETITYQLEQIFDMNKNIEAEYSENNIEKSAVTAIKPSVATVDKSNSLTSEKKEHVFYTTKSVDSLLSQLRKINLEITQWEYDKELGYVSENEAKKMIEILEKRKKEVQTKLQHLGHY